MAEDIKKAEELLSRSDEKIKLSEKELYEQNKKQIDQLKGRIETFKKAILKKFSFISAIGLVPFQASKVFEEEEEIEKEAAKEHLVHLSIIIPNEKEKEIPKIKIEAIKLLQNSKPKVWVHIFTANDIWEMASDGKHEMVEALSMSAPFFDKGLLGALRVASIHKTLCLRKFEKYIVSYVIAGSLVRGEATKTSDVDVFVIVDDTDVKRMPRAELRDKLRGIIYSYVMEASELAGVKNKLSPQIYILTEFWDGVREANPIFFTFIRDGVPLYDRGTFSPWKLLLKMGKITGTPEAIERFLTMGEKVNEIVERKLLDIATEDIYWSVITPSQGALMLYGLAPPTPKETVELMKKVFYEKEKLIEKKYIDFLEHVVIDIYKGFEHEKLKKVSGKEIDELIKGTQEYIQRVRKLVDEVGKRSAEKTIVQIHSDVVSLLENLIGKTTEKTMISKFKSELIDSGKLPPSLLKTLQEVVNAKNNFNKDNMHKVTRQEIERIRKDAQLLIASLVEYVQRGRLCELEKLRYSAKIGEKEGEIYVLGKEILIIEDSKNPEVKKIDLEKNTVSNADMSDIEDALKKPKISSRISKNVLERIETLLKKKIELII